MKRKLFLVLLVSTIGLGGVSNVFANSAYVKASLVQSKVTIYNKEYNLNSYNIDGYNYFRLRDILEPLDFYVHWDQDKSMITINTTKGYEEGEAESFTPISNNIDVALIEEHLYINDTKSTITKCNIDNYTYVRLRDLTEVIEESAGSNSNIPYVTLAWDEESRVIKIDKVNNESKGEAGTKGSINEDITEAVNTEIVETTTNEATDEATEEETNETSTELTTEITTKALQTSTKLTTEKTTKILQPSTELSTEATTNDVNDNSSSVKWSFELLSLVNEQRAKAGIAPLKYSTELEELAYKKAQEMYELDYFGHTSPTLGSPAEFAKHYGIDNLGGQNIAKTELGTPKNLVNIWLASNKHKGNMLNPNFKYLGCGTYGDKHTQMFY